MSVPRLSIGLGSFLVALALVVAVGIGSAIAVIPSQGTYYACLTKKTGAVTVINHPKVKCAKGEKLIKWNAKGPAGPQGAQGPAGPADWNAIPNIPAGFADGVDNEGVTAVKIIYREGTSVSVPPGGVQPDLDEVPARQHRRGGWLPTRRSLDQGLSIEPVPECGGHLVRERLQHGHADPWSRAVRHVPGDHAHGGPHDRQAGREVDPGQETRQVGRARPRLHLRPVRRRAVFLPRATDVDVAGRLHDL